jgi:hypothetical protein
MQWRRFSAILLFPIDLGHKIGVCQRALSCVRGKPPKQHLYSVDLHFKKKPSPASSSPRLRETKRLHSGEAATAGEGGVTRTAIKSLRGGRGGQQRVFAASSLDGAAQKQFAAMEAGGGAVAAPQNRGSSPTGQPQAAAAENRSGPFGHDFLFFSFFSFSSSHQKGGFPIKGGARS